jgi:hypothetical protein
MKKNMLFTLGNKSFKIIEYLTFFLNFFKSLINSKEPESDSDPGGLLITDPSDPNPVPQHWFVPVYTP